MAKTRVYELARDLGVESKDVLEQARELGLEVKTASSGLDDAGVELVTHALSGNGVDASAEEEVATETAAPTETTPEEPSAPEPLPEEPGTPEETAPEHTEATRPTLEAVPDVGIAEVERGATVEDFASAIGQEPSEEGPANSWTGRWGGPCPRS